MQAAAYLVYAGDYLQRPDEVVAIIGVETLYGRQTGTWRVMRQLSR